MINPMIAPALVLSSPTNCFIAKVAVFDCAAFPPPNDPPIQQIAKTTAATFPKDSKPLSLSPFFK